MEMSINNIVKRFGDLTVLNDVSFTVRSGQALGLLGRNGAGKTTTMRIVMDVFKPDSGKILVNQRPIERDNLQFGYMPEERGLYPKHKIKTQLLYLAELNGIKKREAMASITKWLERLEMSKYLNDKLNTLSKGNQQKIQLISVLMCNPDIVILDEPFSGLDPVNAQELKKIVRELVQQGKIVLFSSHQMSYIEEFCDDIAIINQGKIALSGNLNEIKNSYPKTHIQISGSDIQRVRTVIMESMGGCFDHVELDNYNLEVYLKEESDRGRLLDLISQNHLEIDNFSVKKPSLNDIFVKTTGGAM